MLLKFYAQAGRFPRGRAELDNDAVAFVACQAGVPASDLGFYEWAGSMSEYHGAQIRRHLRFRECTTEDADKLTAWLAGNVCQAERRPDQVREELLAQCRRAGRTGADASGDRAARPGPHGSPCPALPGADALHAECPARPAAATTHQRTDQAPDWADIACRMATGFSPSVTNASHPELRAGRDHVGQSRPGCASSLAW